MNIEIVSIICSCNTVSRSYQKLIHDAYENPCRDKLKIFVQI